MSTQAPESDAIGRRCCDGRPRGGRDDDLPAVRGRAHARGDVDGETDIAGIRQCRATAVNAGANTHGDAVGPDARVELALNGHRRLDGGAGTLEHREELVGARVDLAAI